MSRWQKKRAGCCWAAAVACCCCPSAHLPSDARRTNDAHRDTRQHRSTGQATRPSIWVRTPHPFSFRPAPLLNRRLIGLCSLSLPGRTCDSEKGSLTGWLCVSLCPPPVRVVPVRRLRQFDAEGQHTAAALPPANSTAPDQQTAEQTDRQRHKRRTQQRMHREDWGGKRAGVGDGVSASHCPSVCPLVVRSVRFVCLVRRRVLVRCCCCSVCVCVCGCAGGWSEHTGHQSAEWRVTGTEDGKAKTLRTKHTHTTDLRFCSSPPSLRWCAVGRLLIL
jgi:hypothetical protein